MSVTDANPAHPTFIDDYVLQEVDVEWMSKAVKPKQFIHIDQSECICPTGVIILGKMGEAPAEGDGHQRTNSHGYGYGMRLA